MSEMAGSPLSAIILQVVAYHNLTLVQAAVEDKSYGNIRSAWERNNDNLTDRWPQRLSFAAIADITGVDKETVRRSVKKLEAQGWLSIDQKTGISYNPTETNQDKLLTLNEWEVTHLGRLLKRLNDKIDPG